MATLNDNATLDARHAIRDVGVLDRLVKRSSRSWVGLAPNAYDGPPPLSQLTDQACICGKHMLEDHNAGTCVWCGHGAALIVPLIPH